MEANELIEQLQNALEEHWDALANCEPSPTYEVIYDLGNELESLGLGKVLLSSMIGRKAWLTLATMQFE